MLKTIFSLTDQVNQSHVIFPKDFRLRYIYLLIITSMTCMFPTKNLLAADENCTGCHSQVTKTHHQSPHGQADINCTSCHGDGTEHVTKPDTSNITIFTSDIKTEVIAAYGVCIDCHNNNHSSQPNGHSASGIACGSCHSLHTDRYSLKDNPVTTTVLPINLKRLSSGSGLCYECHQDSFAQFEFNDRHNLFENVVACTSCHDPHNPQSAVHLGGFKPSVCSDCHAAVEGPFVYEHAASMVEGCVACHEPHISSNRHMLKFQEVGALCYSCHADAPQFHLGFSPTAPPRFDESTVCTNCHVAIHGSNLDHKLLR